ncbi:MAG: Immunoglobulin I-set domain protein [Armatimonadetes bacterium]|jgi:hypothetical protein|nr:Immunoglobulin I-set domain protein [Armatimonadota bacterium]
MMVGRSKAWVGVRAAVGLCLLVGGIQVATAGVSRWPADGHARDVLGERDGRLVNGTRFRPARVGEGFAFDGQDDAVAIADVEALRLTRSVMISAWVAAEGYPRADQDFGFVVFRGDDRPGLDPYYLGLRADGKMVFGITGEDGTAVLKAPFPLNSFVRVTASLDHNTGLMRLMLNEKVAAETVTGVRPFHDLDSSAHPGVGIGNHASQPDSQFNMPFHGVLDEVVISSHTTLAPTDIQLISDEQGRFTGTVTLGTPAPKGGAVVALGASDPGITVTPQVTIPAGECQGRFEVTAEGAGARSTVIAVYNGVAHSVMLRQP